MASKARTDIYGLKIGDIVYIADIQFTGEVVDIISVSGPITSWTDVVVDVRGEWIRFSERDVEPFHVAYEVTA